MFKIFKSYSKSSHLCRLNQQQNELRSNEGKTFSVSYVKNFLYLVQSIKFVVTHALWKNVNFQRGSLLMPHNYFYHAPTHLFGILYETLKMGNDRKEYLPSPFYYCKFLKQKPVLFANLSIIFLIDSSWFSFLVLFLTLFHSQVMIVKFFRHF